MSEHIAGEVSGNDIAIVGMSGRFPGASGVAELWANIRAGRSTITRFTDDELRAAGVSDELLADPAYVKASPCIDGIDQFDAGFFGFSPKEAQILDPQHRLFLEHTWEALEDAGCDPTRFDGAIGVFGGSAMSHYLTNNLVPAGMVDAMGQLALGLANDKDSLTTRVSHTLGLSGPSYGVQSYCSTSLVAVCAAATSLANFECDLALAGGVAINVPQRVGYLYQQGGISPPDGECRPFDAAGLGAPLGSGVAVVALRRLEDAIADGDQIYAVIRGWAVNNDAGRKVGFTAPGVQGQAAVVSEALAAAGLSPSDIDYVEAHGTGTALGDASELAALQQVFRGLSCLIGSVKSNFGHLDRAAGATNLIKAALSLQFDEIPPSLHLATPNTQLGTGDAKLEVVTELRRWPRRDGRVRRAGVSAFGVGGTNAHVVLEEAPAVARQEVPARAELLVWSARTAAAAEAMAERLTGYLDAADFPHRLADVAHTLQSGRQVFTHRRILVASTPTEAAAALRDGAVLGRTDSRSDREVGFLIAGTGEQYPGMAADLYRTEPVFREMLDECREALRGHLGVDPVADFLRERTAADAASLSALLGRGTDTSQDACASTRVLQPALFAVEYALAQLVRSWGVEPTVLAGYSLGEYVAACLAGVFALDDALALVAHRAQLIDALPAGCMGAVPLPAAEVRERLDRAGLTGVDIAAVNGPELTVIAGDPDAFAGARTLFEDGSVPCRPLATTHAFHSRMLEPVRAELTGWIASNVTLNAPEIPYVSNVTGEPITAGQATDPGYWAEHMCGTVRFDSVLSTLLAREDLALLEIGPGQSLSAMARGHRACPPDRWALMIPTLPAAGDPRPGGAVVAEAIGRLWLAGVPVDWPAYQDGRPVTKVGLPGYPFQRERYWIDPPAPGQAVAPAQPAQIAEPVAEAVPAAAPATVPAKDELKTGHVEVMAPAWTPSEPAERIEPAARCIVLADTGGIAEALAETLTREGTEVVLAPAGTDGTAQGTGDGTHTVVDLRLLDRPDAPEQEAVLPVAAMLDAWGNAGGDSTRIVVVTRGGQSVNAGESPAIGHAAVATLPLVANQEYLNLDCRAVDIDPGHCVVDSAAVVAAELRRPSGDVLAAYRGGQRFAREYKLAQQAERTRQEPVAAIRAGGTYLVTGALGDVGLIVAEHLARSGAGRLVLTSRGGAPDTPGDARYEGVARLRALGTEVLTPRVDVTDPDAMRAVIAGLTDGGRLDGVIHAAADTVRETFKPLRDLDAETVGRHFGAKVTGARVLEQVLDELPAAQAPEFCLVFSSTSSILGGITFGSYSAANAALTAMGQRNHARHQAGETAVRWVAASWDTWACTLERMEGGLGAAMIAHSMSTGEALAALDRMLADPRPSLVVAAGGLDDRLPRATSAELTAGGEKFPRPELPQPYSPPMTATERALAELWADVLGIEPVGTKDNFFDLGGNSLVALQMLALVKKQFGISVPTVVLFEAPTVNKLAATLDEQGASAGLGSAAQPARSTALARTAPRRAATGDQQTGDRRIAIVGMAGRFPGAPDISSFWRNLRDGVESIARFTEEELIAAGENPDHVRDPAYVPARPVLDDISGFDAGFFGMSPRMATITDPQQRLFLEVCWEALETSGYAVPEHRGRVGVFGGANLSTYLLRSVDQLLSGSDVSGYEAVMGNDKDALTTTVSYLFDLYGPSVAVQTFCSTSLVAAHLAVQSLRAGDCEMALAGGVSIRIPDRVGHLWGPGGQESMDGHVRTFDAKARGSMFGDGAAVVVLKRYADAVRDGDHIWAVIRGTAMNNDGALKVGYTAPSVVGQSRVVADALADAGVTAEDISYVECHGTATELGDPIEVASLIRAFGPTETNQYCPIGSVKTNIGHLDRAAGASGLIKTSLALHEGVIPPTLHYTSPNPEIDFENSPFYVNAELSPWQTRDGRPRIAGVSSLGMGGTNVHMILEQAPPRPAAAAGTADPDPRRRVQALPVSARSAAAADQACRQLGEYLAGGPAGGLTDVAYTLQVGRKTFEHRRATVVDSVEAAAAVLAGQSEAGALLSRTDTVTGRQVAFLFAGVGEQYPGLVQQLYRREPQFRAALDECLAALRETLGDVDLADLLAGARAAGGAVFAGSAGGDDPRSAALERTEVVQPALFAVGYALARTLMSWGLRPSVMLGYSLGEYVAACLAGVLTLPDALALVVHRAKLIDALPGGSMVAVGMPAEDVRRRFRLEQRGLDIAAVNGPQMTVVAGATEAMDKLVADLAKANVPSRALQTTHAFHSRMLEQCAAELTDWVKNNIGLQAPALPYLSNVTGELADADLVCDPSYWARHMCQAVQFAAGVEKVLADPELTIVEIGPGQSLGALVRGTGCPPQRWPLILHALPAASDTRADDAVLADLLARLWLVGVDLDWTAYHGRQAALETTNGVELEEGVYLEGAEQADGGSGETLPGRIPLPTYPFQRHRYWIESTAKAAPKQGPSDRPNIADIDPDNLFEAFGTLATLPEDQWLYLPVWRQVASPAPAAEQPGSWLVMSRDGVAEQVLEALRAEAAQRGATVSVVRPGEFFEPTGDGEYEVRPGSMENALALLRELREAGQPLQRVVHLWTLQPHEETVGLGLHALVALARAASEAGMEGWSLDMVTSGGYEVLRGDATNPAAGTLAGPCLVIPLEYPSINTRLIDLAPEPDAAAVADLLAELRRPLDERIVALRHRRRWLPDFDPMPCPEADPGVLREGGVYLITGGLGGIALGMAERMVRDCKAKLVLLARRGLPPQSQWETILAGGPGGEELDEASRGRLAGVAAFVAQGAEIEVVTGDVSEPADVRRAIDAAFERFGALHGVFHTAGVPGMGLIQFKYRSHMQQVLAPKVDGMHAIAQALRIGEPDEIKLDFLLLFSSMTTATGGGPGQVDYCAANAYLDSYAHHLAASGRRVLAIDWAEWKWNAWEAGLDGYDENLQKFFRENRERVGLSFEDGWRALLRALSTGEPRVVVSTQHYPTVVAGSKLFTLDAVMAQGPGGAAGGGELHPRPELVTAYQEPSGEIEEAIAKVWQDSLRLDRIGAIDNFFELGGNSLLGVNIVATVRRHFKLDELPPHILYEAPTVAALAKTVQGQVSGEAPETDESEGNSQVRAQLRRSSLASAARRRKQ
ncbi:MAG TPA: SDR family oxidoreductase [Pseudonocardiaceae bacterium]|nr:SDR family oxidoreductase [Pseudonocardiaceae bacterium]